MIQVFNRKTKMLETEKVAGGKLLEILYHQPAGKLGLELLIKRKLYSSLTGWFCELGLSARKIQSFIESFGIDMNISEKKAEEFKNFNEFFSRKLNPEARPFNHNPELFLSPGDGRIKAWDAIRTDRVLQIKGMTYSLSELLQNKQLAKQYEGGVCILLRLCPVDYHRFHFIDSGVCSESQWIGGAYYSVNPIALRKIPQVFCRNKRVYSVLSSDHFGSILYVEVGATSVGSIVQTYQAGSRVHKGQEKGYFKFGGSTVVLFIEKDRVQIDQDILEKSEEDVESLVVAGEPIGRSQ